MFLQNFAFSILFAVSLSALAQVNPTTQWKKMSIGRFEIIYDSQQQQLAELYAARFSGVLQRLSPYFEQIPEKTTVVISDQTDLTNGSASPLPYSTIMIYPVLPSQRESIGEFGDWASEILTHEYTHILAMNQRRDNVAALEKIFGTIMVPNLLLPRWWHEGLAVEMETRFSNHGRLRSSNQEAWLRSFVLEDTLKNVRLAEANEVTNPEWPYGARPYLFGSILWSHLAAENPNDVKILSWRHGGRFPYLLETPAVDALGMTYAEAFEKTKAGVKYKAQQQVNSLLQTPATEGQLLSLPFLDLESPQISPDGLKLAFLGKDDSNRRSLQVLIRTSVNQPFQESSFRKSADTTDGENSSEMKAPIPHENIHDGPPGGSISGFSWHPDSEKIVYDRIDFIKTYQEASELWLYDLKKEKSEKLKNVIRAREPSFSPDGKWIAYVGIEPGKTNLSLYDVEKAESQVLVNPPLQTRIGSPYFESAKKIYFSDRDDGQEFLIAYDLDEKKPTRIETPFSNISVESSAQNSLLIMSDLNGVRNAYLTNTTTQQPLTHSLTGVNGATLDQATGDLYYSEQTSLGLKLKRLSKSEQSQLSFPLPTTGGKIYAGRYQKPALLIPTEAIKTATEDYSALPYLFPKYWLPLIYTNSFSSYFSVMTSANDPLQKHNWNFYGMYDFTSGKPGYDISYLNQTTDYPIYVNTVDQTISFAGGILQRSQLLYSQISFPNTKYASDWNFGIGFASLVKDNQTSSSSQMGPTAFTTYSDYAQSGAQISPESGQGGSARASSYLAMNNMTSYNQYDLAYVRYFSKILPKHHAVMWKTQWGYLDKATSSANYIFSQTQPSQNNSVYPSYLMRGYATGGFQGRSLLQTTVEYRLPFAKLYKGIDLEGWDLVPFYMKQLHGAFILDGIATDGFVYDSVARGYRRTLMDRNYWSFGAEAKIDTTVGYHYPMMFYFGVYYPLDQTLNNGANFALGLFL